MLKETIICIIIIITIFGLDIFTQNFTENTVMEITEKFSELEQSISKGDKTEIDSLISEINNKWKEKHQKLAYYIEHDELEKVDTSIIKMKSFVETNDYSQARAELEEGKFVLEHIQNKYKFNVENIF